MRLSQYLTEYDEDLSGDSQIDPLGVLTIWSAFGQKSFATGSFGFERRTKLHAQSAASCSD
jgi:hypothetical protein